MTNAREQAVPAQSPADAAAPTWWNEPFLIRRARIPAPQHAVFDPEHVRADLPPDRSATKFSDDQWCLGLLDHSSGKDAMVIDFNTFPTRFRLHSKVVMWNTLNTPLSADIGKISTPTLSPGTVQSSAFHLRGMLRWIEANRPAIDSMNEITAGTLNGWASDQGAAVTDRSLRWNSANLKLLAVARIWGHNAGLTDNSGIGLIYSKPEWTGRAQSEWLGPRPFRMHNSTATIPADVFAPLYRAAQSVVSRFVDGSLPTELNVPEDSRSWLLERGLARQTGGIIGAADQRRYDMEHGIGTRFKQTQIRGAAAVIIAYLTWARPGEIIGLRQDCLMVTELPDAGLRYWIDGLKFKSARNSDNTANTAGEQRARPWATIPHITAALNALTKIAQRSGDRVWLFPVSTKPESRLRQGDTCTSTALAGNIRGFVKAWNEGADRADQIPAEFVEELVSHFDDDKSTAADSALATSEPGQGLTLARVRRSATAYAGNDPLGQVVVGVTNEHMSTLMSESYTGQAASGYGDEIEAERLLAAVGRVETYKDDVGGGGEITGPAAGRVEEIIGEFEGVAARFEGRVFTTEKALQLFAKTRVGTIHDSPLGISGCAYLREFADCDPRLTDPEEVSAPVLRNCKLNCRNRFFAAAHIAAKQTFIRQCRKQAADQPSGVMKDRMLGLAADHQEEVDRHFAAIESADKAGAKR